MDASNQVAAGPECTVHAPIAPSRSESRTRWVVGVTAVTMVLEIAVGWASHSLALLADGWHMATHVGALGLSAGAYWYARTRAHQREFAFGTGKVYALAGYTSAGLLLAAAVAMAWSAIDRFFNPLAVDFNEAMPVAAVGLVINLVCAWLLATGPEGHAHSHGLTGAHAHREGGPGHDHGEDHDDHDHDHGEDHHHGRGEAAGPSAPSTVPAGSTAAPTFGEPVPTRGHAQDHAHRAAYLHVVSDALTSVAAIVAIGSGKLFGWVWADPAVALMGAAVITRWSFSLIAESARQLVDLDPSTHGRDRVRAALEALPGTRVDDLHLWRVGPSRWVCVVAVATDAPRTLEDYRSIIRQAAHVEHVTVEVRHQGSVGASA